MNCSTFREELLDLAAGNPPSGETQQHLETCAACASELKSFRSTMELLDEWQAPSDTSPYFMTRLRARLREEREQAPAGVLAWLRRPALALAVSAALVAISFGLFQGGSVNLHHIQRSQVASVPARPGTAVGDLQYLDKNQDLFANFELLDDIDNPPSSN